MKAIQTVVELHLFLEHLNGELSEDYMAKVDETVEWWNDPYRDYPRVKDVDELLRGLVRGSIQRQEGVLLLYTSTGFPCLTPYVVPEELYREIKARKWFVGGSQTITGKGYKRLGEIVP